ncbi:hypothetical protein Hamer_G006109 [Homarus americanus]|uniref:Uncharacterized protein n=1 Tax=Homarus americanus TaxID=6706 RepID=A0A8J5JIM9_HOMAM|nr:hypothetical protein Hamer_G006109 [Homarus americanus]
MIRHSIDGIRSAVEHLNPGQTPMSPSISPCLPWPSKFNGHGEDKLVVMFGGLHIEMAKRAYDRFCLRKVDNTEYLPKFNVWCKWREEDTPLFQYWVTVLEIELLVLVYVRSLRQSSFTMYLDALTGLAPWFHALDHTNYASVQTSFIKDVHSIVNVIEELSNPFEEKSLDLVALHTKEIVSPSAAETIRNAKSIGQDQFLTFTRERLMEGTKLVDVNLHRNKLKVFSASISRVFSVAQTEVPPATRVVLDGTTILQMLKPATAKNFEEYAQEVFIPYMLTKPTTESRPDLVFDRTSSGWTATRRSGSSSCHVVMWFDKEDKQLVITDGQAVLSKPVLPDLVSIAPCNHEEATVMLLQASHAAQHGHHKILIRTVDTYVVVLAVSVVQEMHQEDELWLAFGTGKSFRYLAALEMATCLGPEKARALPIFHALTGCDTVSSFSGHGKKTAWAIWAVHACTRRFGRHNLRLPTPVISYSRANARRDV